ncbi:serine/threonine protein phosphatase 1 [Sphingomonas endophytica]|uniref:Serine/threonine protein phosphatase 1 n=1 Tax=Sphingomonas endophytica TaxID=869719 RepID=A0A7X0JD95_9SPHN|nr:metallophosphoesterase [Sphingomonas endophytica]MBB6505140.1 serine/threonine protein phosphatase 1 [Sphingomonas endophytica]
MGRLRQLIGWPPARRAAVPAGMRVYAVGDVHGRADLLEPLLGWIAEDHARRGGEAALQIVFLGDLIDRGPASAKVIDLVANGGPAGAQQHVLSGNHEEMLLAILAGETEGVASWLDHGGAETLESYGVDPARFWADSEGLPRVLRAAIPSRHLALLRAMLDQVRIGDYLFVHAGIRPGVPIEDQAARDLRWIRKDFLTSTADHGPVVVHGHTIVPKVDHRHNRIAIDTGAYRTGRLTALGLEGQARWTLTSRLDQA